MMAATRNAYTLRCSMKTSVGIDEAFRVFENPNNLAHITPAWLNFRILTPEVAIAKGARLEYRIAWCGIGITWKTLIEEYEPPFFFVDLQERGPYRLWRHRHSFHPTESGAVVADEVVYALPFGILGRAAHAIAVGRQLKEIFRYRQQVIGKMLGGAIEIGAPVITPGASTESEQQLAHHGADRRHGPTP